LPRVSQEPPAPAIDPFARHLAQLLSIADLAGRLQAPDDEGATARDLLRLAREACRADRASLFQLENADADADEPLCVIRLARDAAGVSSGEQLSLDEPPGADPAEATPFQPAHAGPLLSAIHAGGSVAFGPVADDEPFYAQHAELEPLPTRQAAFCAVVVDGRPVGVLEVARGADEPFSEAELGSLEAAARSVAAAVHGTRRERSVQAMLAELLPELLDPARAPTSLPGRLRQWLEARSMAPAERQAISVATTIAQLSASSPAALELVQTVLSAAHKAFVRDVAAWREVPRAGR
jgi:GAF domain-containing protein